MYMWLYSPAFLSLPLYIYFLSLPPWFVIHSLCSTSFCLQFYLIYCFFVPTLFIAYQIAGPTDNVLCAFYCKRPLFTAHDFICNASANAPLNTHPSPPSLLRFPLHPAVSILASRTTLITHVPIVLTVLSFIPTQWHAMHAMTLVFKNSGLCLPPNFPVWKQ